MLNGTGEVNRTLVSQRIVRLCLPEICVASTCSLPVQACAQILLRKGLIEFHLSRRISRSYRCSVALYRGHRDEEFASAVFQSFQPWRGENNVPIVVQNSWLAGSIVA